MTPRSVGIIGTGTVGASVAISTLAAGFATRLRLHDLRSGVAEGEALDLAQGELFYQACEVQFEANFATLLDCQALVLSAGRNGKPGESRLDLLKFNAGLARDFGTRLRGYPGIVVVISNPVDVLVRIVTEASGLPPERVIGTGTTLETARLRHVLARDLKVSANSVEAMVLGEHGDSQVPIWSQARVGGVPLSQFPGWDAAKETALANEVRTAASEIINRKGATNHAIGLVTARVLKAILRDENEVLPISRVQKGTGIALSMPTVLGSAGAHAILEPLLNAVEKAALQHCAEVLQKAYESSGS